VFLNEEYRKLRSLALRDILITKERRRKRYARQGDLVYLNCAAGENFNTRPIIHTKD